MPRRAVLAAVLGTATKAAMALAFFEGFRGVFREFGASGLQGIKG